MSLEISAPEGSRTRDFPLARFQFLLYRSTGQEVEFSKLNVELKTLIDNYGYWAVLVGTFFEGETILILGAVAAHQGYLHLPWVICAAFTGTLCGDQVFFVLGRWRSPRFLEKHPRWMEKVERVDALIMRFRVLFMLAFRFFYGLRSVTPFAFGMSSVPALHFLIYNALGALVWAAVVGMAGYMLGAAVERIIENVKHYEWQLFAGIALAGALMWAFHFFYRKWKK
jgi:membrane protein DedA with SNARE-associated domain